MLKKHEHSLITIGVVLVATLLGMGLYGLLAMAGFWLGREHAQAEYRYMKLHSINRDKLKFFDGFKCEAWNYGSFVDDLVLPAFVGIIVIEVVRWLNIA